MILETTEDTYPLKDGRWIGIFAEIEVAPSFRHQSWRGRLRLQRWWVEINYRTYHKLGDPPISTYALWGAHPRSSFGATTLRRAVLKAHKRIDGMRDDILAGEGGMTVLEPFDFERL